MSIEWFRDLVIVIFGICATVAVIMFIILAFMFYARLKPIFDSVKKTTQTVERITESVEEAVAKPISQIVSFFKGIGSALGFMKRFTGREED